MSDDLSGDMLAPSWPNLVLYHVCKFLSMYCFEKAPVKELSRGEELLSSTNIILIENFFFE